MTRVQFSTREERDLEKAIDQYEEHVVDEVEDGSVEEGFGLSFSRVDSPIKDSYGMHTDWRDNLRPPQVGDRFRLYARFGEQTRGVDWLIDGKWVEVWYQTMAERDKQHEVWEEDRKRKQLAEYLASKDLYDARIAALPPAMQERIGNFRAVKPDFDISSLSYELFTIEEAVKLARAMPSIDDPNVLEKFQNAESDEQKKLAPDLAYDEHSGNTFGMTTVLAARLLQAERSGRYDFVSEFHGALVGLEGCDGAGCAQFASHRDKS